jgi:lipoyl(octanoyl) transferase
MIEIQNWGLIDYSDAWEKQKQIVDEIQQGRSNSILAFCEHPSVITVGKTGSDSNIVGTNSLLDGLGIQVIHNDRGGDVTLHNPGQLVGYPIFNLKHFQTDLHWFLREIENTIIDLLSVFGIESHTIEGLTGVWVDNQRKICAMGLHCSRWVTSHGFALNVNNNLDEFNYIIPCGINDKQVTSISKEIGMDIDINIIRNECGKFFERNFKQKRFV